MALGSYICSHSDPALSSLFYLSTRCGQQEQELGAKKPYDHRNFYVRQEIMKQLAGKLNSSVLLQSLPSKKEAEIKFRKECGKNLQVGNQMIYR
jgi:hypothetical protein